MSFMLGDTVKVVSRAGIRTSGFTGKVIGFKDNSYGRDKLVRIRFDKTDMKYKGYSTNWYLSCHLVKLKDDNYNKLSKDNNPVKDIKLDIGKCNNPIFRVPEGYTLRVISKDYVDFEKEYPLVCKSIDLIKDKINSVGISEHTKLLENQLEILEKIYYDWQLLQPIIFSVEKEDNNGEK